MSVRYKIVKLLLCIDRGDPTELLSWYPKFDPDGIPIDTDGYLYLHYACLRHDVYSVSGLLRCGASVSLRDVHGNSILTSICLSRCNDLRLLDYIHLVKDHINETSFGRNESRIKLTPLFLAMASDKVDLVCRMLELDNSGINHISAVGDTLLRGTLLKDNPEMVQLILTYGADPTLVLKSSDRATKLHDMSDTYRSKMLLVDSEYKYDLLNDLKEWRPWNHSQYLQSYRQTIQTLMFLAKVNT